MKKEVIKLLIEIIAIIIAFDLFLQLLSSFNYMFPVRADAFIDFESEDLVCISDNGQEYEVDGEITEYILEGYKCIVYSPDPFAFLSMIGRTGMDSQQASTDKICIELISGKMIFTRKPFEVIPLFYSALPAQKKNLEDAEKLFRNRLTEYESSKQWERKQ